MPNYPVTASANDGTTGTPSTNTNGTGLSAIVSYILETSCYGWADLNTSAIGTDTITAATLYWYHNGYAKTTTNAYSRQIAVGAANILNSSATPPAAGWHNEVLTSGELAQINKTGNTQVVFSVADPGTGFNSWDVAAWDYVPTGTRACYLAVTHAAAGGPTKFSIFT